MNEKIRCEQRLIVTVAMLVLGPFFMLVPILVGVAILIAYDYGLFGIFALAAFFMLSLVIINRFFQNYHWIELDGPVIRGRTFWTRRLIEQHIDEISEIVPLYAQLNNYGTMAVDGHLGGPVRGYEIRFRNGGRKMGVLRLDMANADPFMQELFNRLGIKVA
jgi:hypothetical protein